jgi:hypothetical protein
MADGLNMVNESTGSLKKVRLTFNLFFLGKKSLKWEKLGFS